MAKGEIIKQIPDDFQVGETDKSEFRQAAERLVDYVEKNMTKEAWRLPRGEAAELLSRWGFDFSGDGLEEVFLEAEEYSKEKHAKKPTIQ